MRAMSLAGLLGCAVVAATTGRPDSEGLLRRLRSDFEKFASDRQRIYTGEERERRFEIFQANVLHYEEVNSQNMGYWLGVNQFADLSPAEFKARQTLKVIGSDQWEHNPAYLGELRADVNLTIPSFIDWEQRGAVTPVKDQNPCGSCWAFSTTGALEGAWAVSGQPLVSLSEQQLVDCDNEEGGYWGGSAFRALNWEMGGAVCTETSYPYTTEGGSCHRQSSGCESSGCATGIPRAAIIGVNHVQSDSNAMMRAVTMQPVSITVDSNYWQGYSGGILNGDRCLASRNDHAVLLVGYGSSEGSDFWRVKNSWGAYDWGESGYIRLQRGDGINCCGMLNDGALVVVNGGPSRPNLSPSLRAAEIIV